MFCVCLRNLVTIHLIWRFTMDLSEFCIYTICRPDKVDEESHTENKRWVTGEKLLQRALKRGELLPILFGDATWCSDLIAWGIVKAIVLTDDQTTYSVESIVPLSKHSPQELTLRSTRKKIAKNFIRPYAICITPDFIRDK